MARAFLAITPLTVGSSVRANDIPDEMPLDYMHTAGPAADPLTALGWGVTIISLLVMVIIAVLLAGALLRKRSASQPEPIRHSGDESWIWIGTGISAAVLFGTVLWVFATFAAVAKPKPDPALTVAVTGHQWWWEIRYEGGNAAGGFSTANELHIPVGQPVRLQLDSGDVIHSFWVPKLAGKTDTIPGQTNIAWLQADQPGVYLGQCGEYCGLQHAHMGLLVVAEPPADFQKWREAQKRAAPPASNPAPAGPSGAAAPETSILNAGQAAFTERCALCHTVRGTPARGIVGPDLTHLMSRRLIGSGLLPNTVGNLGGWVANSQAQKPGCAMPVMEMSGSDLQSVLAYLQTLR